MALNWSAQVLRLNAFSSAQIEISEKDWEALTGQPEADNRQKIGAGKRFAGKFGGGLFNIAGVGGRLDILLSAAIEKKDAEVGEPFLPSVGLWDASRETFLNAVFPWIANAT